MNLTKGNSHAGQYFIFTINQLILIILTKLF